ncbi:DUF7529 family protein [Halorarius halobius]|uniref:DUF7529 family protein n=1 Tax=Halorarius halobius TaxID=2962671 RepID=UPI0020CCC963|nr:hypothetical protein [Halorarius halobius]
MSDATDAVGGYWTAILEEMDDIAEQYRTAGWTVVTLHPTDVTVVPADDEQFGLVAVVDDEEFDDLVAAVGDREVDAYEVFRADADERVFLLVVTETADGEVAVCLPAYYDRTADAEGELRAHDGELYTRVRDLAGEDAVTFSHENPAPFFPYDGGP